ncbi:MAG: carbohydrate kinase family protein [Candidatus Pacearchaeota archaeon]
MKFDVVCFGSAMIDAFMETNTLEEKGHLMIPYGCKQLLKSLSFEVGGGGTNTSVAFSRLGLKTGYIGKIGNDQNGKSIEEILKKENISFIGKKINGKTSGFSAVLISKNHYRSILAYKGINDEISKKDLINFETKWLYLSSMMGKSLKTQIELASILKKTGTKIVFNPSEYLIKSSNLNKIIGLSDVLILNKEEAGFLTERKNKLRAISDMGPKTVVITDAEKTVYCYSDGKFYSRKPRKIRVVDRTGAGDAFSAGFIAGLIKEKSIDFCMKLGIKEAKGVIKNVGAKNGLIRMKLK